MMRKVATVSGAVGGWAGATSAAVLELMGAVPHEVAQPVVTLLMGVAILSSACLVLQRHQRPLGAAYELGYDMGRRDAIREFTQRSNVSPIRRVKGGLSEFNRTVGL